MERFAQGVAQTEEYQRHGEYTSGRPVNGFATLTKGEKLDSSSEQNTSQTESLLDSWQREEQSDRFQKVRKSKRFNVDTIEMVR